MDLILLRHTEPEGCAGLCYGRTDLAPGSGLAQEAARIEADLPAFGGIVSSPARRCRALAEAIGRARGLVPSLDARLAEMDFGRWEGLPWEAVPRGELDAWAADLLHARLHGGESVAMLRDRVAEALAEHRGGGGSVLVVTHAGPIRAARALAGDREAWTSRIGWGGWLVLRAEDLRLR